MMDKVLVVIDLQNDYFKGGKFPLWNVDVVIENIKKAIEKANDNNIPVVLIQHVADSSQGFSPFFNECTEGVKIHKEILKVASNAKIVQKAFADAFYETKLEEVLKGLGSKELLICGMMTQNCVTHTAISKQAEKYKVTILADCCTSMNETVHQMGLNAISTRVAIENYEDAIK